jgi:hypothetical protein
MPTTEVEVLRVTVIVGVAHCPSPRQNVDEEAPVPEFRLATGRLPVISVPLVSVTFPHDGVAPDFSTLPAAVALRRDKAVELEA